MAQMRAIVANNSTIDLAYANGNIVYRKSSVSVSGALIYATQIMYAVWTVWRITLTISHPALESLTFSVTDSIGNKYSLTIGAGSTSASTGEIGAWNLGGISGTVNSLSASRTFLSSSSQIIYSGVYV